MHALHLPCSLSDLLVPQPLNWEFFREESKDFSLCFGSCCPRKYFLQHREVNSSISQHMHLSVLYSFIRSSKGFASLLASSGEENYWQNHWERLRQQTHWSPLMQCPLVKQWAQCNIKRNWEKMNLQFSRCMRMEQSYAHDQHTYVPKFSYWTRPKSSWDLTDMNEECCYVVQSESKGTGTDRRSPGMEILVEVLTEEKELQRKRSCLVATRGHKGLKGRSTRMTEKEEAWGACNDGLVHREKINWGSVWDEKKDMAS